MKRALLIATIASGAVFLFASRAPSPHAAISPPPTRVGANAVWTPSPGVLSDIRQVCSAGDPDQQKACFLDSMKSAGASDEAAAFVKSFAANGLAYVRAFRDTGRVDIAYIEYLFRANELDGVLLVNGTPPIIDVDDYKLVSQEDLRKNADYRRAPTEISSEQYLPGDRYHTEIARRTSLWPHGSGIPGRVPATRWMPRLRANRHARMAFHFRFDSQGAFPESRRVSGCIAPVAMKTDLRSQDAPNRARCKTRRKAKSTQRRFTPKVGNIIHDHLRRQSHHRLFVAPRDTAESQNFSGR